MSLDRFRHIVIEGPIGVGKSTLARKLSAHLGAQLLLEQPGDNPFLDRYYRDGARFALPTQLFFLFQRIEQLRELSQPGIFAPTVVSDFLFDKDALFAQLTLDDDEYRLYTQIHQHVAPRAAAPDLVIWLQASAATLLQRVRQRAIAMEQDLSLEALERLTGAYAEHFSHYDTAPVLAIDTEYFNPAVRPADFERLLERLAAFQGPKEYFDPQAEWGLQGGHQVLAA